jgi:hypothetical protein
MTMRDEDKPFICYKQGWSMTITPRNAEGWRLFAIWMVPLFAATGLFVWISFQAQKHGWSETNILLLATLGFLPATLIWAIAMIRWMMARSEIIDVNGLIEIKREQDIARKKRGR